MRTTTFGFLGGLALFVAFVTSPAGGTSTEAEIAFLRMTEGFWQVWGMEADGTGELALTQSKVNKVHLDWRPGTPELLYETGKGETFLLDTSTGKQRKLLKGVGARKAVWSPDGKRLVYEVPLGIDLESRSVIWVSKPDGRERTRLTEEHFKRAPAPRWYSDDSVILIRTVAFPTYEMRQEFWIHEPSGEWIRWSGNDKTGIYDPAVHVGQSGTWLAYSSLSSGFHEIWTREETESAEPRRITDLKAYAGNPSWSPDGEALVFESDASGQLQLYRVSDDGADLEQLTNGENPSHRPVWKH